MSVRQSALLAAIGLVLIFILRMANTAWPTLYGDAAAAQAVAGVLVLADLFLVTFFFVFQRSQAGTGRPNLLAGARVGLVAAIIGLLVRLRIMMTTFGISEGLAGKQLDPVFAAGEVLAALGFLWFFAVVCREARDRLRGTGLALVGASIFALFSLTTFVLEIIRPEPMSRPFVSSVELLVIFPLAVLAVAGVLTFFVQLWRNPGALA
jgi:hypothetical protein